MIPLKSMGKKGQLGGIAAILIAFFSKKIIKFLIVSLIGGFFVGGLIGGFLRWFLILVSILLIVKVIKALAG